MTQLLLIVEGVGEIFLKAGGFLGRLLGPTVRSGHGDLRRSTPELRRLQRVLATEPVRSALSTNPPSAELKQVKREDCVQR